TPTHSPRAAANACPGQQQWTPSCARVMPSSQAGGAQRWCSASMVKPAGHAVGTPTHRSSAQACPGQQQRPAVSAATSWPVGQGACAGGGGTDSGAGGARVSATLTSHVAPPSTSPPPPSPPPPPAPP